MEYSCKKGKLFDFIFYQSVRDHKPVWMLEDMRKMERYYWDEDGVQRTFSPSEGLLYAIVHDHRAYAQYLLNQFSDVAFAMPGTKTASNLAMAVHYERKDILATMLQVAHRMPSLYPYINHRSYKQMDNGMTALHLACKLSSPELIIMLLGSGASPQAEDNSGMKPLDLILKQLRNSKENTDAMELCLEKLLIFMPEVQFKMKNCLKDDPQCWSQILEEETYNYLVGRNPGTLFLKSMQKILSQLPPNEFYKSLDHLPIPTSLNPLTLPSAQI